MSFLSRFKNPSTQQLKLFDNKSLAFFKRKKVLFVTIILLIFAGVFCFVWWQNQKDVRELNKNLPAGIKVIKSFIGKDYKVVNKIDGYEVKIPKTLRDLKTVEYYKEKGTAGISIRGAKEDLIGVGCYKPTQTDINLEQWVKEWTSKFKTFNWSEKKEKIGSLEVIKMTEEKNLPSLPIYFFKKGLNIYEVSGSLEDFSQEVIANGRW